jgi:hypothetical protein
MDSPQNQIWGPSLWKILHSSAELIGSSAAKKIPQEESRIWMGLLASLRFSLPCPLCKKHYSTYYNLNPIKNITKESIRGWLFNLHNEVNKRAEKQTIVTLDQLPEIYKKPTSYVIYLKVILQEMKKALVLGWSSREDIKRTERFLLELKNYYDLV